jgi:hypothetical protein
VRRDGSAHPGGLADDHGLNRLGRVVAHLLERVLDYGGSSGGAEERVEFVQGVADFVYLG